MKDDICIGLFGTCGDSTWRDTFIRQYTAEGFNYFNPQLPVGTWKPKEAVAEAEHLANDDIIVFPVLAETYGLGSLAETGFSIMSVLHSGVSRYVIVYIDELPAEELKSNMELYTESRKARALVLAHLKKLGSIDGLYIVDSMEQALIISKILYSVMDAVENTLNWADAEFARQCPNL